MEEKTVSVDVKDNKDDAFERTTDSTPPSSSRSVINPNVVAAKMPLNLSVLDGLRCITCYSILTYHIHLLYSGNLFLRTSPCSAKVYQSFGSNVFFKITFHMTMFWIISGFLCEYQLHKMYMTMTSTTKTERQGDEENIHPTDVASLDEQENDKNDRNIQKVTYVAWMRHYVGFFINRLLRIYPLYVTSAVSVYIYIRFLQPELQALSNYWLTDLVKTLLFVKKWNHNNAVLPTASSWSVQVDVHGYVAVILLFACTHFTYRANYISEKERSATTFRKRSILVAWYIISIIHVLSYRPLLRQNFSPEGVQSVRLYGWIGIETKSEKLTVTHVNREALYPDFDFDNELTKSIIKFNDGARSSIYFGDIFNHGSAFMLGSLLYINLYVRNGQPSFPCFKLFLCIMGLIVTRWWYSLSGIFMYLLLDALLTMKPVLETTTTEEQNTESTFVSIPAINASQKQRPENVKYDLLATKPELVLMSIKNESQRQTQTINAKYDLLTTNQGLTSTDEAKERESTLEMTTTTCREDDNDDDDEKQYQMPQTKVPAGSIQSCLTYVNHSLSRLSACVCYCVLAFLSNPIFKALSPYTYGIYLFQQSVFIITMNNGIKSRAEVILNGISNGEVDSCHALEAAGYKYDLFFVFKESLVLLSLTTVLAVFLYWTVEAPVIWFRKRWLPKE